MACLLLTSVIWGLGFVAQRAGLEFVGAFTFNGVRFALGVLPLIPVTLLFERNERDKPRNALAIRAGMAGGLVLFLAASLQQFGVALTSSAGKSGFITGLYIVIVPILGIFLGRKTTTYVWLGALCACVGLYLLSARDGFRSVGLGDAVLLLGAVIWAVHILLVGAFAERVSPIRFSIAQFCTCAGLSLACAFIFEEVSAASVLAGYVPVLYAGLGSVGIAYTLQIFGQRNVEPARAAIIFSLESLFAALGGALILSEVMEMRGYIGCALIFAGILISQVKPKPPQSASRQAH